MMDVSIAYGKGRLTFQLDSGLNLQLVEPTHEAGLPNQKAAVLDALRNPIGRPPLRELFSVGDRVGIVFSDITRATPYDVMLPPLIEEIESVAGTEIVLFNATGTHRPNTNVELEGILGPGIVGRFRIVQNDCTDSSAHRVVGTTPGGNQVSLLSEFLDCEVKVLTGFIEPHFFAGFSGGGKAIMPGLAALETIQRNHKAAYLDDPNVRWGITKGNPLWMDVASAARMAGPSFIVNVALNRDKQITAVFAGDFDQAHARGCEYVKHNAMAPVDRKFDIVVTSNSGYPLDLNLYQSVKGMSAAAQVAKPGGIIIVAADCWDGIPDHGKYGELLRSADSTESLLARIRTPGFAMQDMWQAHIHALLCQEYRVHFYSENLSDEQIGGAFMTPCRDIGDTVKRVAEQNGGDLHVCVLPEGPLTIPYVI
jgi:lactate racemase